MIIVKTVQDVNKILKASLAAYILSRISELTSEYGVKNISDIGYFVIFDASEKDKFVTADMEFTDIVKTADGVLSRVKTGKKILHAKLANSVKVLSGIESAEPCAGEAVERLNEMKKMIENASDTEELMGIEGYAARSYFAVFDEMLKTDDPLMKFEKRTQRPPENNVNALLSFIYTLMKNDVSAAVESAGLDIQVGTLHTMNYGKPSLVLDMMEEYRAALCDRFAVSLVNRRQITSEDFCLTDGEIKLTDKGRKVIIQAWQKRKSQEIYHSEIGETISTGLIPFVQATIMAAYIRGERQEYVPFLWR